MCSRAVRVSCVAILLTASLAGCSSLHPNLEPTVDPKDANLPIGGIAQAGNIPTARDNLRAYYNGFHKEEIALRKWLLNASDWTASGLTAGVLGGMFKSPETALIGAALGGTPTVLSDRYKIETQAGNFEIAAKEMHCLHLKTVDRSEADISLAALNAQISKVVHNLVERQKIIKLLPPNLAAMQADMQKVIDARAAKAEEVRVFQEEQRGVEGLLQQKISLENQIDSSRIEFVARFQELHPPADGTRSSSALGKESATVQFTPEQLKDPGLNRMEAQIGRLSSQLGQVNIALRSYEAKRARVQQASIHELSTELATCVSPLA